MGSFCLLYLSISYCNKALDLSILRSHLKADFSGTRYFHRSASLKWFNIFELWTHLGTIFQDWYHQNYSACMCVHTEEKMCFLLNTKFHFGSYVIFWKSRENIQNGLQFLSVLTVYYFKISVLPSHRAYSFITRLLNLGYFIYFSQVSLTSKTQNFTVLHN